MIRLGVNIDHVATVRNARGGREPDPVAAAVMAELGGADQITVHLREDRRHIRDRDVRVLGESVATALNLEMAVAPDVVSVALEVAPASVTLVPERREELTTEGGLDVPAGGAVLTEVVERLRERGIRVSLFIDPTVPMVEASRRLGVDAVELHTGTYAEAAERAEGRGAEELAALAKAARAGRSAGLEVAAGHGLDYRNVAPVVAIPEIEELNIGHSIVARSMFVGLTRAVTEMRYLMNRSRPLFGDPGGSPERGAGPR